MHLSSRKGQSLVELIVAVGIGVIFIVGAIGALTVSLRLESQSAHGQPATELATKLGEQLKTIANNDWHNFDSVATSSELVSNQYSVATSAQFYVIQEGAATTSLNDIAYTTYFTAEDVFRDDNDEIVAEGGTYDPSTLKFTLVSSWSQYGQTSESKLVLYLARLRNRLWTQTDWSGGPSTAGPATASVTNFTTSTNTNYASTTGQIRIADLGANLVTTSGSGIDATYRYAWNDLTHWIDFGAYGNISLATNATTTGYASSSLGLIALDCATTPAGNICPTSLFGVTQDGAGTLSGFSWNDGAGWISFNCASAITSSTPNGNCAAQGGIDYQVSIDQNTGFFYGWAWSDIVGWISFNCDRTTDGTPAPENLNLCAAGRGGDGTSDYAVKTGSSIVSEAELMSRPFDAGSGNLVVLNTLTWNGSLPAGTRVLVQIASGNDPDQLTNFIGRDGTSGTYYEPIPGVPLKIKRLHHANVRYMRYKLFLQSDTARTETPRVNDIHINYSL